jgi:hypothetical protein
MKAPRLAIVLVALGASVVPSLIPLTNAGALVVPRAATLPLPSPNSGLNQGYLPFQSCSSAGNCAVTGVYIGQHSYSAGVIDYQIKGVWQKPVVVRTPTGTAAAKGVSMEGLSCPAAGACVALGQYSSATNQLPFVQTQIAGKWQKGVELALPPNAMGASEAATPRSIACVSAGNCTVVGTYSTDSTIVATQGFIATELKGAWRQARELSLPKGTNANPFVSLSQVTCWSLGDCLAVGSYVDSNNVSHAMVVPEVNGAWRAAAPIGLPGSASAFAGAQFNEVACTNNGSCLAAGTFNTASGAVEPIVALSTAGVWARALRVSLPNAAANPETLVYGFKGVSCASPGNCAFGGQYLDTTGRYQGFFDNVINGNVERAQALLLPSGARQAGHNGGVVAMSCVAVGRCVAGAAYLDATNKYQAIIITETNYTWSLGSTVTLPPGSAGTVGVGGGIYSLQCFTPASCEVTGSYQSSGSRYDGFALSTQS